MKIRIMSKGFRNRLENKWVNVQDLINFLRDEAELIKDDSHEAQTTLIILAENFTKHCK